ncbi:phage tail tape measure protein [Parabacteroides goldsteinii]|uniref:phage tail tape measure protein n=1 Tax=Parabacteroides goldsteinii TaxID=328812 RepID=UPI001899E1F7|nr:phage tail tape measure protein [Parabacteroides goldsteinii]
MGIVNRDGALYMATGVDNSGLYAGRREAMGIIKAMAGQITSIDVFSGIGISAATAFASAAKSSYDFEKEFQKNILEVATISTQVEGSMTDFMNRVMAITQEIPVKAPEAAKALYQIVSAGHDGADGINVLEVAARSAIGGMTDTATAADAITTLINAYKLSASDAERVSDQLFTTARLGKTTFGELGQSIAQVAPIAASYGVEMDQVLAAVATLTKSGTPTAQAMTQIRASIIGASKVLGDGAFNTRTFQEGLAEIAARAGGSESKLRELIPEVEAVNGVLGLTGIKAQDAAEHLKAMNDSTGATSAAFELMMNDVDKQMTLLSNNIQAALRPMGQAILKEVSEVATAFNEAFENGDVERAIKSLGDLIVIVTGAFIGYKGAVTASTVAQNIHTKALVVSRLASIQHITTSKLMTNAIKAQTVALLKNIAALATNPYVLAAAAVAALGYGLYKYATQATAAEKATAAHNKRVKELSEWADKTKESVDGMLSSLKDENVLMSKKVEIYRNLQSLYPDELKNISLQNFLLMDSVQANNLLAKALDDRIKAQQRADVNAIEAEMKTNDSRIATLDSKSGMDTSIGEWFELRRLKSRNEQLKIEYEKAKDIVIQGVKDETAARKAAEDLNNDNEKGETVLQRKIALTKKLSDAEVNLKKLRAPDSTAKNSEIKTAEDKVKEIKGKLEALTGISGKEGGKLKQAQADLARSILDNELKLQADRIAIMKDGKDKRVLLADQEYKETIAAIQKEKEEYQKKIKEAKGKEDPAVLSTFTDRENSAKDKRNNDVANIAKDYSDQLKSIQNDVDSHFRSQLDNRLIEIDSYYKEQIKIAKEAGEEEEGDFIQMLIRKQQAEREYARKESALSTVDFKEQVDLGHLENKSNDTYFVEETERQKTEIVRKYALERITILDSMGDEQSKKDAELLRIAVEGYDKALSKPSKKSINNLIDEKAIKALQKRFMDLGMSEEEAKEKAIEYAEGFKGKMQMVADVADSLKTAFGGISDELDMALDAVSNIAQGFAEGGLIGGISAAAGQLVSVVSNLFTAKKEIDKSMVEGYETYMDAINDLIDTQVALLDKLGGMAFGQNIIDTTKDIAKSIAASRTLFNEAMRAGSGMFSHSDGYKANKMLKGYVNELREVGIYTTDLSRMTNEQLALLKKLPEVYARLPEGLRKYIDAIAEGIDKTEEFKDQIQDTVLGLDFTSITDMIVNSVTDPSIDNALEELEVNIDKTIASIAQNMLRRNMLLGPLEKMTNDLYKSMEKKDKDGNTYYKLTAESAKSFKDNVLGLGKQFQDAWKELEEAFSSSGIDLMPKDQETTEDVSDNSLKGAYAKANQESINLLAGQTGAQRVAIESIREQMQFIRDLQVQGWKDVTAIKELVGKLKEVSDKIYNAVDEIKGHTGELSEYSERTVNAVEGTLNVKVKM